MDWIEKSKEMVEYQLKARGITDAAVLNSMLTVPRHIFVTLEYQHLSYSDSPLPIGSGQTISQPYIVALMAEALMLSSDDKVLEIGTGSGYGAAVLSRIAQKVYTIERHKHLAEEAISKYAQINYTNIFVKTGDGTEGWKEEAPFDGIVVTAGGPKVPKPLLQQLGIGKKLVIPVGSSSEQRLIRITRKAQDAFEEEDLGGVRILEEYGLFL